MTNSTATIQITYADAEMIASWAEEGLKGHANPLARESVKRFRRAMNDAATQEIVDRAASPRKDHDEN